MISLPKIDIDEFERIYKISKWNVRYESLWLETLLEHRQILATDFLIARDDDVKKDFKKYFDNVEDEITKYLRLK